jgi:hypothetical protein
METRVNQWNRIEDPEINSQIYGHKILNKESKSYSEIKKASSATGAGITGNVFVKKIQIDPYLLPCTKLKSKWIKGLNIKSDTLNVFFKFSIRFLFIYISNVILLPSFPFKNPLTHSILPYSYEGAPHPPTHSCLTTLAFPYPGVSNLHRPRGSPPIAAR